MKKYILIFAMMLAGAAMPAVLAVWNIAAVMVWMVEQMLVPPR